MLFLNAVLFPESLKYLTQPKYIFFNNELPEDNGKKFQQSAAVQLQTV